MSSPIKENPDIAGPIILWVKSGYEGWSPTSYPTIDAALAGERYTSDFVITRKAVYRIVEESS